MLEHFHMFEIKIMSSFKSNEAWFQTSILYEILPLYKVMGSYCISCMGKICNMFKYVTFINMFIFSLNGLIPCRSERV